MTKITAAAFRRSSGLARPLVASLCLAALNACGGGGGDSGSAPAAGPPTALLTASAANAQMNAPVTLTWSSTNATSCSAAGAWSGALAASGTKTVTVSKTSAYQLTCTGSDGSATDSVTVVAWSAPAPSISADVTSVLANNTVTLTWTSANAATCTGAGGLTGTLPLSGSAPSAILTSTTVFSLDCSNPAYAAVQASVTVTVSATLTTSVAVRYQAPGAPVLNSAHTYFVPNWANPVTKAVPFVLVELRNPSNGVVAQAYADASGTATFSGLDPTVTYTPVVRSAIKDPALGLDFVVLNNTAPLDTSQPKYRARYATYASGGPAFTPNQRLPVQNMGTLTAPDGWDATQSALIDANRIAAPYALLANAVFEAQVVSSAIGGTPAWRPLTILWSTKNKGGLVAPPNQVDQGYVTGSGGYYNSSHSGVDASGTETGSSVAEDLEFISGDQTTEPMDIYPFVLAHEMGHFTQRLFSTSQSPGGPHGYDDFEDPTQAWVEGNASGIAALVLNTSKQNRIAMVNNSLVVGMFDMSGYTINGNAQAWPLGWFQEATVTRLMWQVYDPSGSVRLPAATVLAPMYTAAWKAGPWLNTPWAYSVQLAKLNPGSAIAIKTLADSIHIRTTGNDEWGSNETDPGNTSVTDALPPYTSVSIGGGPTPVCSVGAPNDYNKQSNTRYLRVSGDGATHTITIQGAGGTVPLLSGRLYTAGSSTYTVNGTLPSGSAILGVADCSVALSPFSTDTAACTEPSAPAVEQCWTVTIQ